MQCNQHLSTRNAGLVVEHKGKKSQRTKQTNRTTKQPTNTTMDCMSSCTRGCQPSNVRQRTRGATNQSPQFNGNKATQQPRFVNRPKKYKINWLIKPAAIHQPNRTKIELKLTNTYKHAPNERTLPAKPDPTKSPVINPGAGLDPQLRQAGAAGFPLRHIQLQPGEQAEQYRCREAGHPRRRCHLGGSFYSTCFYIKKKGSAKTCNNIPRTE